MSDRPAGHPAINRPWFGRARIATRPDGIYEPDLAGEWAVVAGAFDANGELGDLVAWFPERPGQWWRRTGDIPVLGARELAIAADGGWSIWLFPTPNDWLFAHGDGVCIIDWAVPLDWLFDGVARVECPDPALGDRLARALRRWEPDITLTREVRHAA